MGDPQGKKAAMQPLLEIASKMVSVCECVCQVHHHICGCIDAFLCVLSVCMCVTVCVLVSVCVLASVCVLVGVCVSVCVCVCMCVRTCCYKYVCILCLEYVSIILYGSP